MTIVEFLNARYDEGTQVALRIIQAAPMGLLVRPVPRSGQLWSVTGEGLLRDIEAKRAILSVWEERSSKEATSPTGRAMVAGIGIAVQALAPVYENHPDYDPKWSVQ